MFILKPAGLITIFLGAAINIFGQSKKGMCPYPGTYLEYDLETCQLKREGLFDKGVLKEGIVYVYESPQDSTCSIKYEIKNKRKVKESKCSPGEGRRTKDCKEREGTTN